MNRGSGRFEKITECVKHVPFPVKPLIWSVIIRDFHEKIKSCGFSVAHGFFLKKSPFFSHEFNNPVFILVFIDFVGNYGCNKQESQLEIELRHILRPILQQNDRRTLKLLPVNTAIFKAHIYFILFENKWLSTLVESEVKFVGELGTMKVALRLNEYICQFIKMHT